MNSSRRAFCVVRYPCFFQSTLQGAAQPLARRAAVAIAEFQLKLAVSVRHSEPDRGFTRADRCATLARTWQRARTGWSGVNGPNRTGDLERSVVGRLTRPRGCRRQPLTRRSVADGRHRRRRRRRAVRRDQSLAPPYASFAENGTSREAQSVPASTGGPPYAATGPVSGRAESKAEASTGGPP